MYTFPCISAVIAPYLSIKFQKYCNNSTVFDTISIFQSIMCIHSSVQVSACLLRTYIFTTELCNTDGYVFYQGKKNEHFCFKIFSKLKYTKWGIYQKLRQFFCFTWLFSMLRLQDGFTILKKQFQLSLHCNSLFLSITSFIYYFDIILFFPIQFLPAVSVELELSGRNSTKKISITHCCQILNP